MLSTAIHNAMRRGARRLQRAMQPTGMILLYHRVATLPRDPQMLAVQPKHFEKQMIWLRANRQPMHLHDLAARARDGRLPRHAVAVTFDDGYADNLHEALPILERHDMPATVFIATAHLASPREMWWDRLDAALLRDQDAGWHVLGDEDNARQRGYRTACEALRPLPVTERDARVEDIAGHFPPRPTHRLLGADEIAQLAQHPLITVAAHTHDHPQLSALPLEQQREQIQRSRRILEEITDDAVTAFSYPYGSRSAYTAGTVALVADLGFDLACSNFPGVVTRTTNRHQLPRVLVRDGSADVFASAMKGWVHA